MAKDQRKEKPDLRKELTERLMQQMENGSAFWQKPWEAGAMEMPHNAVTNKPYRGVNAQNLLLFSPDPADNRWCTYKQAQEAGWQVKAGEHGTSIEKWSEYTHKRTAEEIQTLRESGAKDIEPKEKRLGVRYYNVFHASQIEGIPEPERKNELPQRSNEVDARLPVLAENLSVDVQHSGSRAFYRTASDRVNLPPIASFQTGRDHDTIFLHELSHSTGHESRLNRDLTGTFGSQKYAKEELRAELSAAMTALSLGIGFSPDAQKMEDGREVASGVDNTSAYLTSWLGALPEKDRQKELMGAISQAQKMSDYLIERTPEQTLGLENQIVNHDKYFVYEEHTLGFIRQDEAPNFFTPLAGQRDWRNGGFTVLDTEKADLRPATEADFEKYRVVLPSDFTHQPRMDINIEKAGAENNLDYGKRTDTTIILTSIPELKGYTRDNGNDGLYRGEQQVEGVLTTDFMYPHYGDISMNTDGGPVRIHVGKRLFMDDEAALATLFAAGKANKPAVISVDNTGKKLTIDIEGGPKLINQMQSRPMPFGLVDMTEDTQHTGKLVAVGDDSTVILAKEKGEMWVISGSKGKSSEATLEKMVGKQVSVSVDKDRMLAVSSLEKSKSLSR